MARSDEISCMRDSLLLNGEFQAPLSRIIQANYNKLVTALVQIPKESRLLKIIDGTGGKVSIAEIVAYQIGWANLIINWYDAGIQGKMPDMPGEGFSTWDYIGLAQCFYQKYHYDGFHEQDLHFQRMVRQILIIVEKGYKTGNLERIGIWPWCTLLSGKQWPLSKWIMVNTSSPYKRALKMIKPILREF